MCSATDSYDIALAAEGTDICESMFDGDGADPNASKKLDYSKCFAFTGFGLKMNPTEYEFSDIDTYFTRSQYGILEPNDLFTLFDFSAKWDPIPTMLCQNHESIVRGFWGQSVSFNKKYLKLEVLVMELKSANEARYIHGDFGRVPGLLWRP